MAKISFDVDGTLRDDFFGNVNPYKNSVQELAKRLIADGHDVLIVTRRYKDGRIDEHTVVYELAEKIGISIENVHFTNREWKYIKLHELGVDFHIDDDDTDVLNIKLYNPITTGFLLKNADGIEEFYKLCNQ
jgi:hypothetical protein